MHFPVSLKEDTLTEQTQEQIKQLVINEITKAYEAKESLAIADKLTDLERYVIVQAVDKNWQDHTFF